MIDEETLALREAWLDTYPDHHVMKIPEVDVTEFWAALEQTLAWQIFRISYHLDQLFLKAFRNSSTEETP